MLRPDNNLFYLGLILSKIYEYITYVGIAIIKTCQIGKLWNKTIKIPTTKQSKVITSIFFSFLVYSILFSQNNKNMKEKNKSIGCVVKIIKT